VAYFLSVIGAEFWDALLGIDSIELVLFGRCLAPSDEYILRARPRAVSIGNRDDHARRQARICV